MFRTVRSIFSQHTPLEHLFKFWLFWPSSLWQLLTHPFTALTSLLLFPPPFPHLPFTSVRQDHTRIWGGIKCSSSTKKKQIKKPLFKFGRFSLHSHLLMQLWTALSTSTRKIWHKQIYLVLSKWPPHIHQFYRGFFCDKKQERLCFFT